MKRLILFVVLPLCTSISLYKADIRHLNPKMIDCTKTIKETVIATVYHAEASQCNSDYSHTAFNFELNMKDNYSHRIIAVSRDLLKRFPNKSKVKIKGTAYDGIYTVRDKMNKRYKKRIDILINKDMKIGKWDKVIIEKI